MILEHLKNLFPLKGSLVNAQQKKKTGKEKQKKWGGEKAKSKRRGGQRNFFGKRKKKRSRNFAFCACPNFESSNLASGMKATVV